MIVLNLKIDTHKIVGSTSESENNSTDNLVLSSRSISRKTRAYVKSEIIVKKSIEEDLTEEQQKYLKLYNELHENKEVSSFKARIHVEQSPERPMAKPKRAAKTASIPVQEEPIKVVEEPKEIVEKVAPIEEVNTAEVIEVKEERRGFWRGIRRFFKRLFKNKREN